MNFVSDTSPLIAFSKIGCLSILRKLFGKVLIPQSVYDEFLGNCTAEEKVAFEEACQKYIIITKANRLYRFRRRLDIGERDALSLAMEKRAIIIIDDRKGFNEAVEMDLIAVSTRAVLKIAEEKDLISDFKKVEKALREKSCFLPMY